MFIWGLKGTVSPAQNRLKVVPGIGLGLDIHRYCFVKFFLHI